MGASEVNRHAINSSVKENDIELTDRGIYI